MMLGDLSDATTMRLRSISLYQSVQAVADAFSDAHLGIVVICDDAARAVGLVSKSDLVRHMARGGSIGTQVAEIMTRPIISASPGDDLHGTWKLMVARRLQNLPLLDRDQRPVGTLDIRDALQAVLQLEEAQEEQLINYIAGNGYR